MYKIATITFHHAYNFGSVLQTYALQETIKEIANELGKEIDYKIIDFYPVIQEELYNVFKPANSWKNIVKNIIALPYAGKLKKKNEKFEKFLTKYCNLTSRYRNADELKKKAPFADCYISGSDQIWNVRSLDFCDIYYYSFLPDGAKRISYAASLGPLKIDWKKYAAEHIKSLVEKYSFVSVRESGSKENLEAITSIECEIHIDPTLLLSANVWRKIQSKANYNNGQYILLYCLEPTKEQLDMAKAISKKLELPIIVLRYSNKNDAFNNFIKMYDSGPEDFLSYIDHAALVLSSSFHGTAFSLVYHKPFYVFHGMNDHRISEILRAVDMPERSLDSIEEISKVTLDKPNCEAIDRMLIYEQGRSKSYLKKALGID